MVGVSNPLKQERSKGNSIAPKGNKSEKKADLTHEGLYPAAE